MADFSVTFREEAQENIILRGQNTYRYPVVFHQTEELGPVIFSPQSARFPVSFEEEKINDSIFGGVSYIVHDYGELPIATRQSLGCVIVGENLSVEADGTLSADAAEVDALTNMEIEQLIGGS